MMRVRQLALAVLAVAAWLTVAAAQDDAGAGKAANGKDMPVRDFLAVARYPQFLNAWARMRGTVYHQAGERDVKVPIELRARFMGTGWKMQVVLNDTERWGVWQFPADGRNGIGATCERPAPAGGVSLASLMIPPADIALAFLYYDFERELDSETVSTRHCRVLQLADVAAKVRVRVWIDTEAFFPLRVQEFRLNENQPYLQLDFKGMVEVKSTVNPKTKLCLIDEVLISNPGWKTRIRFDKAGVSGDEINDTHPAPADLFVPNPPATR